jgi:hypothetical protein
LPNYKRAGSGPPENIPGRAGLVIDELFAPQRKGEDLVVDAAIERRDSTTWREAAMTAPSSAERVPL